MGHRPHQVPLPRKVLFELGLRPVKGIGQLVDLPYRTQNGTFCTRRCGPLQILQRLDDLLGQIAGEEQEYSQSQQQRFDKRTANPIPDDLTFGQGDTQINPPMVLREVV